MTEWNKVSLLERQAFVRLLTCVARAEEEISDDEEKALRSTAGELGYELTDKDFEPADLQELLGRIRRKELRERLLPDMKRLAEADGTFGDPELARIKYVAERWSEELPDVPGVDWEAVKLPNGLADDLAERASRRRKLRASVGVATASRAAAGLAGEQRLVSINVFDAAKAGFVFGAVFGMLAFFEALLSFRGAYGMGLVPVVLVVGYGLAFGAFALLFNLAGAVMGGVRYRTRG